MKKQNKITANIVMPPELKAAAEKAALASHLSLSAFVCSALRKELGVK